MQVNDPFKKIFSLQGLKDQCDHWRSQNETIVFTNGVFDLLHPGHVLYLAEAKELGDRLIVGLNSDESVKLLNKGEHRPIQGERARSLLLSALEMVDAVVVFSESTPLNVITTLLPDILVKGGDYKIDQIVGAKEVIASGGKVQQLRFVDGYSTTAIEAKIRNGKK